MKNSDVVGGVLAQDFKQVSTWTDFLDGGLSTCL